jgi:hypothetical protein
MHVCPLTNIRRPHCPQVPMDACLALACAAAACAQHTLHCHVACKAHCRKQSWCIRAPPFTPPLQAQAVTKWNCMNCMHAGPLPACCAAGAHHTVELRLWGALVAERQVPGARAPLVPRARARARSTLQSASEIVDRTLWHAGVMQLPAGSPCVHYSALRALREAAPGIAGPGACRWLSTCAHVRSEGLPRGALPSRARCITCACACRGAASRRAYGSCASRTY